MCSVLVLLVVGSGGAADDKPKDGRNAREALEAWVAAVLAGKGEEAKALLADPGEKDFADGKFVKELQQILGVSALKVPTVHVSDKSGRAVGVSEAVRFTKCPPGADDPNPDVVTFEFDKVKDKWLLTKIEFKSEAGAKKQVERFRTSHPEAQELPPKSQK